MPEPVLPPAPHTVALLPSPPPPIRTTHRRRIRLETPVPELPAAPAPRTVAPPPTVLLPPASPPPPHRRTHAALHAWWTYRGIWLPGAALGLAALGQSALVPGLDGVRAGLYFAAAMLLGLLAWSSGPAGAPLRVARPQWRRGAWRRLWTWRAGLGLRLIGIAGALALTAAAMRAWDAEPLAFFGRQGVYWVCAMALLVGSCARWYTPATDSTTLGPLWTRGERLVFAAVVALTLATRLLWLHDIPWRIDPDEHIAYTEGLRFVQNPPTLSLFTTSWFDTGMPSMWLGAEGGFMRLLGIGLDGVRFWTALVGALVVIPIYALARQEWGRVAGFLAGLAGAVLAVIVHYSRVSMPNMGPPLWWVTCFYFVLRGLRSRRPNDFVWAGLAAGTSIYTFYSTRTLPLLLVVFALYLAVFHFRAFRERIGHFALVAVGFIVGFGPLIAYFQQNPQMWLGRGLSELLIPLKIPSSWAEVVHAWTVVAPELQQNLLGLSVMPSRDGVYFAPLLLPAEAFVLVLGIGTVIWRWRQPAAFLLLLWGGSSLVLNSLVISGAKLNPNLAHWSNTLPAFCIVLALPPAFWLAALRRGGPGVRRVGAALVAGWAVWMVGANAYFYLITYPVPIALDQQMYGQTGRFLAAEEPGTVVLYPGQDFQELDVNVAQLLAPQLTVSQLYNPSRNLPVAGVAGHSLVFVLFPSTLPYLSALQYYYPGGHSEPLIYRPSAFAALTDPGVITPGTLYRVPADQVTAHYGVTATFTLPDHPATPLWTGPVPAVGSLPPGLQLAYPLQAAWSGAVFLPADGPISLQAPDFPAVVTTTVAGQVQPLGALFQAEAGWLPFSVQTQLTSAPLHLLLQQGGAPPHEIAPAYLWPQPPDRGLAVFVQGVTGVSRRIDPFVGAALSGTYPNSRPGELPPQDAQALVALPLSPSGSPIQVGIGQITWAGEVLTEAGIYTLELHTDAQVRLVLDDQVVLEPCSPIVEQWRRAQVSLTAGPHHVQLDFAPPSGTRGLEWLWTRPDGVREVVPPSRLRYRSAAQDALPPAPVPADLSVCTKPPPGPPTALHPQAILAADTGLQEPHGIAVDAAGQIYVADTDHHRVVHLDPAGKVLGFWGTAPTTSTTGLPGSFNRVNDLAVTRTGNPVTLDGATGDVQEFTPTGALQLRLPAVTSSSVGIAVGPDGRIWLADTAGSRLVRLTADGHPDAIVTGGAGNPLNQPIDVALAPDGTPYVVDILRRIVRLDSQGQVTQAWPVEIGFNGSGSHLAFWRGQVVWTDPDRHRLGLLDPGTGAVRYVGQAGSAPGEFRLPLGLAIGPNDNLYVLDSGNARIQVFSTLAAP